MANSVFLKPSLSRLLIDHARIGYTIFRPTNADMEARLSKVCGHHDEMLQAIGERDEAAMVRLVFEHWELSRGNMEIFIAPRSLTSKALNQLRSEPPPRRPRTRKTAKA
jgi:DNA-binding GntR family transcriptional regulator